MGAEDGESSKLPGGGSDCFLDNWTPELRTTHFSRLLPFVLPALVILLEWLFQMPQPGAAILGFASVAWGIGYIVLSELRPGETLEKYGWRQWDGFENEKAKAETLFIAALVDSRIINGKTKVDAFSYEIADSSPDTMVIDMELKQVGMTPEAVSRLLESTPPALGAYSVDTTRTGNTSYHIVYSFTDPVLAYKQGFRDSSDKRRDDPLNIAVHQPESVPITLYSNKAIRAIIAGVSGAGKTVCLQKLLCEIARAGADHQCVILDPKRVGFIEFARRFDVIADSNNFTIALDAIYDEMMRRYDFMQAHGVEELSISDMPLIYVVIDEVAELFDSSANKQDREHRVKRLTQLCTLSRQANMSIILATQTPSTDVLPSQLRNQLDFRICLRMFNKIQAELIAPTGMECPAYQLPEDVPGMGYFLTSSTPDSFTLGRVYQFDKDDVRAILKANAGDKLPAPWLDAANPLPAPRS